LGQAVINCESDCFLNPTHNTEDVVVGGVDTNSGGHVGADGVVGDGELQDRVINAGEVAGTRGLVLLRLEGERVDVHTSGRHVGVVLVRLHLVEVAALTDGETIVAVELEEGGDDRVLTSHTFNAGHGVTRFQDGTVPEIREVERLLPLPVIDDGIRARDERITLHNPDKLLARMVEVELDLVGRRGDGFTASELEGLNEVLVGDLGELTTFISVEVDVVNVEGGSDEASGGDAVTDWVETRDGVVPAHVAELVELEVDTNLVVLEGNEREGETSVAVEPELERDVEGVFRGATEVFFRGVGDIRTAVGITGRAVDNEGVDEGRDVTDHLGVTSLLTGLLGEFVPEVEPFTVVLVNALTTDFNLHGGDEVVARPVEPTELGTRGIRGNRD
jgi:hypothetical protein